MQSILFAKELWICKEYSGGVIVETVPVLPGHLVSHLVYGFSQSVLVFV